MNKPPCFPYIISLYYMPVSRKRKAAVALGLFAAQAAAGSAALLAINTLATDPLPSLIVTGAATAACAGVAAAILPPVYALLYAMQ